MGKTVKVILDRELSDKEIEQIIDVVEQHAYVKKETVFTEADADSEVLVDITEQEDEFIYEIPIAEPISQLDARFMAEKVADFIPDNFELGATYHS